MTQINTSTGFEDSKIEEIEEVLSKYDQFGCKGVSHCKECSECLLYLGLINSLIDQLKDITFNN